MQAERAHGAKSVTRVTALSRRRHVVKLFATTLFDPRSVSLSEESAELALGALELSPLRRGKVPPRAVRIEREHAHRRAVGRRLSAFAPARGARERFRDSARASREHRALEIEGVARLRNASRPAPLRSTSVSP